MRAKVRTFDVTIGDDTFRVDAFDWRSAQQCAQKRYMDRHGMPVPFVPKSAVVKAGRP